MNEPILRACKLIEEANEPPTLNDLARKVGLSPFYFQRLFKKIVGITPKVYAATHRQRRVQEGLRKNGSVTQAIFDAGFGSSSRFYDGATDLLGMTPSNYKKGAEGLMIRYAITDSYLGLVLVAATERGLCVIDFGDTPAALRERLVARFPSATLVDDDADFAALVQQVLAFIDAPARGLDLPLDVQGTAFQRRVWEVLRAIPAGSTLSYAEVAKRIGKPAAIRAVARACATNPVAVVIPCHRVIGSDGSLKGYAGGLEKKRALLDREAEGVAKATPGL